MRRTTVGPPSRQSNASTHGGSVASGAYGMDRRSSAMPLSSNRRNSVMSSVSRAASASTRRQTLSRKADPRPTTDRRFIEYSVQTLYAFLLDRGFQENISEKQLKSPTTKDFQNVFGFLISLFTTFSWTPGKRLEEEVTTTLRVLQYPFTVSKSALSAIGSSHTWPQLLAVLTWLMDLAKVGEPSYTNAPRVETSKASERREIFREHIATGYSSFLDGEDDLEEQDIAMGKIFEERSSTMKKEVEEMIENGKESQEKLSQLRGNLSPLEQALSIRRELENRIEKFNILIPSMLEHREAVENKIEEKNDDMRQLTNAIENLTLEKKRDIQVIDSQRSQSIHAQQISNKRLELRKGIDDAIEEKNLIDESVLQARDLMQRVEDEVEILMRSYRHYIEQFVIDAPECNLKYDNRSNSQEPFPNLDQVVESLRNYREKVEKEQATIEETVLKKDWESDVLEDKAKSTQLKVEECRSALKRHEQEFEEERQNSDAAQKQHNEKMNLRKREAAQRRSAGVEAVKELEEKFSKFSTEKSKLKNEVEMKMKEMVKDLVRTSGRLAANRRELRLKQGQFEETISHS